MKWKLDRKYTTIAVYALLVIAFALVLCTLFLNLRAIGGFFATIWENSLSVLFGVFFTFCLLPAVNFFEKLYAKLFNRRKEHPTLVSIFAAFTVDLFFVGILVGLFLPSSMQSMPSVMPWHRRYLPLVTVWRKRALLLRASIAAYTK